MSRINHPRTNLPFSDGSMTYSLCPYPAPFYALFREKLPIVLPIGSKFALSMAYGIAFVLRLVGNLKHIFKIRLSNPIHERQLVVFIIFYYWHTGNCI